MSGAQWFSASLIFAVLTEGGGLARRWTTVVLVQADDFEDAFRTAVRHGEESEEVYVNAEGAKVRWALERVETLDALPETLVDGVEVYSAAGDDLSDPNIGFETKFNPRASEPGQSGIQPT
ncbi:MAG: DUF4288 domain-containing protein [Actinomycetota bacterium]